MPQVNAWWDDAKCKDVDPEVFTPKKIAGRPRADGTIKQRDWSEARKVCFGCPVVEDCLQYTLSQDPPGDVGGYDYLFAANRTPDELMRLRRRKAELERRARR